MTTPRYDASALHNYARDLLAAAGMPEDKAQGVADILIEGDLLGHTTHGLQLLPSYLREVESGSMNVEGQPHVIRETPAALTWDGRRLPGPWLVLEAMKKAVPMAKRCGTGTVVIRKSHHIACLAAFHKRATEQGMMMILASSDANSASVAPYGGLTPVFTPNPISFGIPTSGTPIVTDISTSATTNGLTNRLHQEGGKLPAPWVIDGHGKPSNDPAVLFQEPKGTILPLGGLDSGHKGYGLSLTVEALTGGLAGFGRADPKQGWGATVFLQVLDPAAFGGSQEFVRQMDEVARQCHAAKPAQEGRPVRLPGEKGFALAKQQAAEGVVLHPGIMEALKPWAEKLKVAAPAAL
ncbi:Ldh family oxidoreductase [Ramlibacter sp. USB13]|uniref:Ldh family oxidoreductase n=1 Tax=Ramlibacter cellulosilyticus TaxID=2764187 RepID=A0A923MQ98_9BURK|nr:Ldh family oxidoreductase [Ramlibacter cellulosilyticus]MBC5783248.1 Ldh family oxidoreductase [Ramlibacter cellulosilyticus]